MKKSILLPLGLFGLLLAGCGDAGTMMEVQTPGPVVMPDPMPPATMTLAGTLTKDTTVSGTVLLDNDTLVPAGVTLTVQPGTTVRVKASKLLSIKGVLAIPGTAAQPVKFLVDGGTGTWVGINLSGTGQATLSYIELRDALVGLFAMAGTTYVVDHMLIERSDAALTLASTGTITKSVIHGRGVDQISAPVQIIGGAPQLTDVLIDNARGNVDMIVVSGTTTSPKFDHLEVTQSHCAFHFNEGQGITLTNSYVHDNSYALMVYGSKGNQLSGNNFVSNSVHIGVCSGGTMTTSGNFFSSAAFDQGCGATLTNTAPAGAMLQGAGVRP